MKSFEIMEALTDLDDELLGIEVKSNVRKKTGAARWLGRVAALAAVVMLLTVSVFAADVALNDGALLAVFFGDAMSDDEINLMDDIGRTFGESVTSNGATITAIQAVSDESVYWLHLRVEAPEGVVLPDIQEDEGYFYYLTGKHLNDVKIRYKQTPNAEWKELEFAHTVKPLYDANPTDNVKEFVITFYGIAAGNTFARDGQTRLIIPGLYIHKGKSHYLQTLLTGGFVFDISMDHENLEEQKIFIDTGTVSFYNEEYDYTTTVNKVTISPLHIDIDCTYTAPNDQYIFPYGGPIQIVMKDGTTLNALDAYFDARDQTVADPNDVAGTKCICFDTPIVIESIDYIVVGTEHVFDLN